MGDPQLFMQRAIDLARRAEGQTTPNPMVGCVLVRDGRIVGEGFHARPGGAHAEVAALRDAGDAAQGATAYVTLEPCNHTGRTGPCAGALIAAGVAEVFYAVADPNPLAAGGAEALRTAGIRAESGLCAAEGEALIRPWLHRQRTGRPFFTAKYAASLDGRIATGSGDSKWISSEAARMRGHDLRQAADAIIVGVDTVLADDPALTARAELRPGQQAEHPLRIILDSSGRTPPEAKVLRSTTPGRTLIITTPSLSALRRRAYEARGAEILTLPAAHGRVDLAALPAALAERGLVHVMIEGGAKVLGGFFDTGLVDEVWAFIAPVILGGSGPAPVAGHGVETVATAWRMSSVETETHDGTVLFRALIDHEQGAD